MSLHPLARQALTGVAQASGRADGLPDALAALVPAGAGAARVLLLEAGAWAVYRAAGARPSAAVAPLSPCPAEPRSLANRRVEQLLVRVWPEVGLLRLACERLDEVGMVLPLALLPAALAATGPRRELLRSVLGERGRWLARLRPDWGWAVAAETPDEAGAIDPSWVVRFEEGRRAERMDALRRMRSVDPARGRELLAAGWSSEAAAERGALLGALEVGLSPADLPFVEAAETDRAKTVRRAAHELLLRMPGSALAGRMRERADATARWAGRRLELSVPDPPPREWEADGIALDAVAGFGPRAAMALQLVARVPPSYWEGRFGVRAAAVVGGLTAEDRAVAFGLARGAVRFGARSWARPLYSWLAAFAPGDGLGARLAKELEPLLEPLPEGELIALLDRDAAATADYATTLGRSAHPWSRAVATAWLHGLARHLHSSAERYVAGEEGLFEAGLKDAVVAIPDALIDPVLGIAWPLPDAMTSRGRAWRQRMDNFADGLRLRRRILTEIPGDDDEHADQP